MDKATKKTAKILKALANERRLKILEIASRSPRTMMDVSEQLNLSFRSTSKHLQKLAEAGLIVSEQKSK